VRVALLLFAVGWCAVPRSPPPCVFREAPTGFALVGHVHAASPSSPPSPVFVQTLDGLPADRETVEMLARVCAAEGAR
jgi:hypothetical protein